ncbi:hypothetical protein Scep_022169 [Stephania cephalantha]|uniref:Uncharacterized protein n=1 Tax=Stephania cephalantha TaxID=152367 RepID=A0AAP0F4V1_9MAGN
MRECKPLTAVESVVERLSCLASRCCSIASNLAVKVAITSSMEGQKLVWEALENTMKAPMIGPKGVGIWLKVGKKETEKFWVSLTLTSSRRIRLIIGDLITTSYRPHNHFISD